MIATVIVNFVKNNSFYIIMLVMGFFTTYIGFAQLRSDRKKLSECVDAVDGIITNYKIRTKTHRRNNHPSFKTYYYPVYRYTYADQEFELTSNISMNRRRPLMSGQQVTVMVNPNHPEMSYIEEQAGAGLRFPVFLVIGILLSAFAVAAYFTRMFG